jgi:hypothetical protein
MLRLVIKYQFMNNLLVRWLLQISSTRCPWETAPLICSCRAKAMRRTFQNRCCYARHQRRPVRPCSDTKHFDRLFSWRIRKIPATFSARLCQYDGRAFHEPHTHMRCGRMVCPELTLGCGDCESLEQKSAIRSLRELAFLGLAFCVFAWGLQYKLSLYDPPQTASHQVPKAKLLSRDEQSSTVEHPLVIRTRTSTSVIYTAPTAVFLILFLAISLLNPPASRRLEKRANRLFHLHRAVLNTLFVRPPPVLA